MVKSRLEFVLLSVFFRAMLLHCVLAVWTCWRIIMGALWLWVNFHLALYYSIQIEALTLIYVMKLCIGFSLCRKPLNILYLHTFKDFLHFFSLWNLIYLFSFICFFCINHYNDRSLYHVIPTLTTQAGKLPLTLRASLYSKVDCQLYIKPILTEMRLASLNKREPKQKQAPYRDSGGEN